MPTACGFAASLLAAGTELAAPPAAALCGALYPACFGEERMLQDARSGNLGMITPQTAPEFTRRTFLAQVIGGCIAFLATVIGIPSFIASIAPALERTEAPWLELGRTDRFPVGTPTSVDFTIARKDGWVKTDEIKQVWVVRDSAGSVTVYNGRCTHLGCAYHWEADQNQFVCPCHAGVFAFDGRVLAGPPPRSLDPLPNRIDGDRLLIQYVDFRLGITDRVEA